MTFAEPVPPSYSRAVRKPITNVPPELSRAFSVQRMAPSMSFTVNVSTSYHYDVDVSFAELRYCQHGAMTNVMANGIALPAFNALERAGCRSHFAATIVDVVPDAGGSITVTVNSSRQAGLAAACFRRRVPMIATKGACTQVGCRSTRGPVDFTLLHGSLAGANCTRASSSTVELTLRPDVQIVSADLQWAGSGVPAGNSTSVLLNGMQVQSDFLWSRADFHTHVGVGVSEAVYTASADVTAFVRALGANRTIEVGGLFYKRGAMCRKSQYSSHMAGWTLVVVYEREDLPLAQVNVCARGEGVVTRSHGFSVGCLEGVAEGDGARVSVVVFEGESGRPDSLAINDHVVGSDLFAGRSGTRMDVLSFPVVELVEQGVDTLQFSTPGSEDGVLVPVRVTYQPVDG